MDYTGSTSCVSGYTCKVQNEYYSQCIPGSTGDQELTSQTSTALASSTEVIPVVSASAAPTSSAAETASSTSSSGGSGGKVSHAGVVSKAPFDPG